MKQILGRLLALVMLAGGAGQAAAGLPLEMLPATSRWVLHLDVQALGATPVGKEILAALTDSSAETDLQAAEATLGLVLRRDIVCATVCGAGNAEQGGVLYLRGSWDATRLDRTLAANSGFSRTAYGRHALLSWRLSPTASGKPGGRQNACLAATDLLLLASRPADLQQALDTLDGKTPALATVSQFRRQASLLDTNACLRLVARDVKDLFGDEPEMAALPATESMRLALAPEGAGASVRAVAKMASAEGAQQMQGMLTGLQTMLVLRGMQDPVIGRLAQSAHIDLDGQNVILSFSIPAEAVSHLIVPRKKVPAATARVRDPAR